MTPSQLIAATLELTGITLEALARKLAIPVGSLRACADRVGDDVGPDALRALRDFYDRARRSIDAEADGPRVETADAPDGVVCADALEYVETLPEASVDLIVSDIPYGIGHDDWDVLHPNTNSAYLGRSAAQERAGRIFDKRRKPINGWSRADREIPRQYHAWCASWGADWLRVLKPGGSAFVFAGRRYAPRCALALEDAGFNLRDLLAWIRPGAAFRAQRLSVVLQKRGELAEAARWQGWRVGNLRPTFEPILWFFKPYDVTIADNVLDYGVGALNVDAFERLTGRHDNAIECGFRPGEAGLHEAQKPVDLLRALIELTTPPGALVLDPFAGSGSTGVAAREAGRRALLIERDARCCELARARLSTVRPGATAEP